VLTSARQGAGLGVRVTAGIVLLVLEKTFLNHFVDSPSAQAAQGLGALVHFTQHWGFRFLASFAVAAALFAYLRGGRELQQVDAAMRAAPLRPRWLLAHVALVAGLVPLSVSLYGPASWLPLPAAVTLWLLLAVFAVAALLIALAPWALWASAARSLGALWGYAALAGAGSTLATGWSQQFWYGAARVTFEAVKWLLGWLVPTLQTDSTGLIIDTGRFAIEVAPVCSGLEGMGLMLAFCTTLLVLFRREFIFPRALLLIPLGMLLSFVLNIVRIAALVLIGDAGYVAVVDYGFHSQAGWLAFNAAAVGIALVSLRTRWFCRAAGERAEDATGENPTAVYLLPFLALVLGGMLRRAASASSGDLYWLPPLAVCFALGYSWPRLRTLDWHFSWRGPMTGLAAALVWLIATHTLGPPLARLPQFAGLSSLQGLPRATWIAGLLVSLAVVPLAEELAFRGYLLRRLRAEDFESIPATTVGVWPVLVSSVVYGVFLGLFWLPGIVAGAIFGFLYARTGRLGEAVVAHATGNAMIAAWVLAGLG
jgi:exosortase E/protease (VPEID-CTERM system)